jgi:nitroimidazol reductase NimA-like FMN-containing flavoprotein (pyridoxamine 5'-phosphate oxidase superfamily)
LHETAEDVRELQRLLDESHSRAGRHLRRIFSEERRIAAVDLPALLPGVQVLHLATVTPACEPRVAPVDGLFFRARFWFGSARDSNRFRNIRARPAVSVTVTHGEELAVIVHGTAQEVDTATPELASFRDYCREVYGNDWNDWGAGATYARVEPRRMFTFSAAT